MRTSFYLSVVTVVCALMGACPAAADISLGDGSYDVTFSASEGGNDFAGTTTVSGDLDDELFDSLNDGTRTIDFSTIVFTDSTFRLSIEALGAAGFGYPLVGTFELTGLDIIDNGLPADITDVTFDAARTDIGQYQDAGQFIPPTISFAPTSVTVQFGFDGEGLAGDQPFVYFNLSTTVIPEPAAWTMLVAGAPLVFWPRRLRKRNVANAVST